MSINQTQLSRRYTAIHHSITKRICAAKAKLDEAEATLKRTRRLIELGVGAGKDLVTAETAYKTAKA